MFIHTTLEKLSLSLEIDTYIHTYLHRYIDAYVDAQIDRDIHTYQVNFQMMCIFMVGVNEGFESICFLVTIARFWKFWNLISMILNIY